MRTAFEGRHRSAGQGKVGCLFWLLLFAVAVLFAVKTGPVYIRASQFKDSMSEQAKFAQRTSAEGIQRNLLARAQELRLPITTKQIAVQKGSTRIRIEAEFTVPVDYYLFQRDWTFRHQVDEPVFVW